VKLDQRHGKSRVRVARVWREPGGRHRFVEWNVNVTLLSDCLSAYIHDDNADIVATDTMKNTVYVKAKEAKNPISVEEFAISLGTHFTSFYPQVTAAIIHVVEKLWERITIAGQPHDHGFKLGSEKHTTEVTVNKSGALEIASGIQGLALLKTTQSGFEGFIRDKYTLLPETQERILATEVAASWRYIFETSLSIPTDESYFVDKYNDVKKTLVDTFFGPPKGGVYSASVQSTLYRMAKAVLDRVPDVSYVTLQMPNLHFLPVNLSSKDFPAVVKFEDDVYLPTDEPHGSIEATLRRIQSRL
ncbi:uricase, partial [Genlisea aurea]